MHGKAKNRIDQAFEKEGKILNIYFTAGFPQLSDTLTILKALERAGADIIEIGMPYSDPVADGPTIQKSNQTALENGMNLRTLFQQLEKVREEVSVPIVLMGYLNPVIQYGMDRFLETCAAIGIDGTILPDMPLPEYVQDYRDLYEKHGVYNIFLITPQTSEERVRQIDKMSHGFIYMVAANSITGSSNQLEEKQITYFKKIDSLNLRHPRLIGFGISDRRSFEAAAQHAHGAIIGSAFIKLLEKSQNLEKDIADFVTGIKGL